MGWPANSGASEKDQLGACGRPKRRLEIGLEDVA
jgi:hypothetical protein